LRGRNNNFLKSANKLIVLSSPYLFSEEDFRILSKPNMDSSSTGSFFRRRGIIITSNGKVTHIN